MNELNNLAVLGGEEGAIQRFAGAVQAAPDRISECIDQLLQYPGGIDYIKTFQINSCVAPIVAGDKTYRVYWFDAVVPKGYSTCYWRALASLPQAFEVFESALETARAYSQENNLPLLFEVGHYCKAPEWVCPTTTEVSMPMLSDIYPVTKIGRRIKFASASNRKFKGSVLGEPDRVGWKTPFRKRDEWEIIHLYKVGEELSRSEKIVKDVVALVEELKQNRRFNAWSSVEGNSVSVEIEMVFEKGWYDDKGQFNEATLKRSEYQSFDMTFEQAAVALPIVRAALSEVEIKPSHVWEIEKSQNL